MHTGQNWVFNDQLFFFRSKSVILIINTYLLSITVSLLQIFVKFQPRDAGEYEQSWDLMVSDKSELVLLK